MFFSVHAFGCFKVLGFVSSFADRGMRLEGPGPSNWIKGAKVPLLTMRKSLFIYCRILSLRTDMDDNGSLLGLPMDLWWLRLEGRCFFSRVCTVIGFLRGAGDSLRFPNLPKRNPQGSPGTPPPIGHPQEKLRSNPATLLYTFKSPDAWLWCGSLRIGVWDATMNKSRGLIHILLITPVASIEVEVKLYAEIYRNIRIGNGSETICRNLRIGSGSETICRNIKIGNESETICRNVKIGSGRETICRNIRIGSGSETICRNVKIGSGRESICRNIRIGSGSETVCRNVKIGSGRESICRNIKIGNGSETICRNIMKYIYIYII